MWSENKNKSPFNGDLFFVKIILWYDLNKYDILKL